MSVMSIKLIVLKSGEDIVSDIQEMVVEEKCVGYILKSPYKVKIFSQGGDDGEEFGISFFPWIPLTNQENILIPTDWVVTLVEPIDEVIKLYGERTNDTKTNKDCGTGEQSDLDKSD